MSEPNKEFPLVFVLSATIGRADTWVKQHMSNLSRRPIGIMSLEQLRGVRNALVIILQDSRIDPTYAYSLDRNTVIDLRIPE